MASTAAVVYIKPSTAAYLTVNGQSGAVVYMSPRGVSGQWATGVSSSTALTNLLALLPQQRQALGYVENGRVYIEGAWWRYLYQLATVIIGQNPIPLADVVTAVLSQLAQSQAMASTVDAIEQQAQQNAASLSAVVQVAQAAALPGASQIPLPQTYMEP